MTKCANAEEALAFVREHGVVLASARGAAPRLTEAIAGEAIRGSWWAHPQSHRIYAILQAVTEADEVLVCRLIGGKVTLVHRRLWPSLVALARRFAPEQLARVREEHTASGRHVGREIPFPEWVPADVAADARGADEREALATFGAWVSVAKRRIGRRLGGASSFHSVRVRSRFHQVRFRLGVGCARLRPLSRSEAYMKRVTGIGGIFFKAKDPVALGGWYKKHLGIDVLDWGGAAFRWTDEAGKPTAGTTVWSVGSAEGDQFAPSKASFMINYRVADLHSLLEALRAEGCNVLEKTDDSEYGKFGWVIDPEGNKVELWQPPEGE